MDDLNGHRWSRRRTAAVVGAVILVAAITRLYGIRDEAAWYDEIVSLRHLDADGLTTYLRSVRQDDRPMTPVYFTLQYLWSRMFGADVAAVRLLSVSFSVFSVPLVFLIGRELYGDFAGAVASACFALVPIHIYYGQEIRMYALVILLALASLWSMLRILRNGGRWVWAVHLLSNVLLVFTHLLAFPLVILEGLLVVYGKRSERRALAVWISAHAVLAGALAVWAAQIDGEGLAWWITPPTLGFGATPPVSLSWTLYTFTLRIRTPEPSSGIGALLFGSQRYLLWLTATMYAAFVIRLVWTTMRTKRSAGECPTGNYSVFNLAFLGLWIAFPAFVLFVLSYAIRPVFVDRYVLYSSIGIYVMAGAAIASFRRRGLRIGLASALIALYALQATLLHASPLRKDWRVVASFIRSGGGTESHVQMLPHLPIDAKALAFNFGERERPIGVAHSVREAVQTASDAVEREGISWLVVRPEELVQVYGWKYEALRERLGNAGLQVATERVSDWNIRAIKLVGTP